MPEFPKLKVLSLILFAPLALGACGKDAEEKAAPGRFSAEDTLLQYVADDTPYVFAMLEPAPDDVMDKMEPQIDVSLKAYHKIIRGALREEIESGDAASEEELARMEHAVAVVDEMGDLFSLEGIRNAGIGRDSTMVVYGAGLLPVARMSLTDAAAFEATIARIEKEAGASMAVAEIDDQSYRHIGDDQVRVIMALVGSDLVVSLVPDGLGDDSLREILGLTPPAGSLADSGRLEKVAADNGFTAYFAGYADVQRVASVFLDAPAGINADLLAAMDYSSDELSPVCKEEIRALAATTPRLLSGYTDLTVEHIESNTILELRSDLAEGLAKLAAPVPGMGADQGGLFSFGMSLDLMAARDFYAARLDALEQDPFQCEHFAELQASLEQGREVLNQPAPPVVYGIKGFLAVVENIEGMDVATKTPPTSIDMRLLVATENAPGLLAMGSMFSPEIAALNLQPDGKPVRLEAPQLTAAAPVDAAYVAMSDTALALALGEGTDRALGDLIAAPAGEPPPFMSMHMDAARYYTFMGDAMKAGAAESSESTPEVNEAVYEIMTGVGKLTDRLSFNVMFTERGIEFPTDMTLAK